MTFSTPTTKTPGGAKSRPPMRIDGAATASGPAAYAFPGSALGNPPRPPRMPPFFAFSLSPVAAAEGGGDLGGGGRLMVAAGEQHVDVGEVEGLVLEQGLGDLVEPLAALEQDLLGPLVLLVHDAPHLGVDLAGGLLGVGLRGRHVAPQEDLPLLLAEGERPHALAHAPLADHGAGHVGGLLDVVAGAGGLLAEGDLLGDPAAHEDGDLVEGELLVDVEPVLLGELLGEPQGAAAGDDGDLVQRVGVGQDLGDQRVARPRGRRWCASPCR